MRDGVARLPQLTFHVPGATAHGSGAYNLVSKRIDLKGQVAMQSTVSEASGGGLKSVLLKPFNGLFPEKEQQRRCGAASFCNRHLPAPSVPRVIKTGREQREGIFGTRANASPYPDPKTLWSFWRITL